MAPEVIDNNSFLSPYGTGCDIWSAGITAIELAEAGPPLAHVNPMRALLMIPSEDPPTLVETERWSPEFQDFLAKCLSKDADERPTAADLLQVQLKFNKK
jgi:serine/threonine protein kinase